MALRTRLHDCGGQATVELAALLPVILIVAAIAVNAFLLFGECAAFDRVARQAVRTYATSPAYGQGADQARARIQDTLSQSFCKEGEDVSVEVSDAGEGCICYTAHLSMAATLFGMGLKEEVFGVSLPKMNHEAALVVDPYNPAVLL